MIGSGQMLTSEQVVERARTEAERTKSAIMLERSSRVRKQKAVAIARNAKKIVHAKRVHLAMFMLIGLSATAGVRVWQLQETLDSQPRIRANIESKVVLLPPSSPETQLVRPSPGATDEPGLPLKFSSTLSQPAK